MNTTVQVIGEVLWRLPDDVQGGAFKDLELTEQKGQSLINIPLQFHVIC